LLTFAVQGKKEYQEKLLNNFQLSERVPKTNFYRLLKDVLPLDYVFAFSSFIENN